MKKAENTGNGDCSRTDSTECKGYVREQSTEKPEIGETEVRQPRLLEAILETVRVNEENPLEAWKKHIAKLTERAEYLNEKAFSALHYNTYLPVFITIKQYL